MPSKPGMGRLATVSVALLILLVLGAVLVFVPGFGGKSTSSSSQSSSEVSTSTTAGSTAKTTTTTGQSSKSSSTTTGPGSTGVGGNYSFVQPSFFVAPGGNDAWSGTLAVRNQAGTDGPFATLQRAQAAADALESSQPGRASPLGVEVESGTFELASTLTFAAKDSGTSAAPIVWESALGGITTIGGGKEVTGWTRISGNEWTAPAAGLQYFEQMWKDGQRIYRPSSTNGSYLYVAATVFSNSKSQACSVQIGTKFECFDRFEFRPGDMKGSYYDINSVEIDDFECWTMPVMRLKSVDMTNDTAFLTGTTSRNSDCHGFITGHRYLVQNVMEDLAPGQWYYDKPNARILYMANPGEDPNAETFVAPQLQRLVLGDGVSHVEFLGLTFSYANWVVSSSGWTSPQGEELTSSGPLPAALNFTGSSYVTLANDTLSHLGAYAISFTGTGPYQHTSPASFNEVVANCKIYDIGAGGIVVGKTPSRADTDANVAQYTLIWNSVIAQIGRFLPGGNGIYILNAHNNLVGHDVIYGTYSNAVSVGGTYNYAITVPQLAHDNTIEYTLAFGINQGVAEDGGALYTASGTAQHNVIRNNVVHDVVADINASIHGYGGWGIYFDSTSQNVVAENNLVYRTSFPSIHQNDGFNNSVTNNILAFGGEGLIDRTHNNATSLLVAHNIFYYDSTYVSGSMQRGIWACLGTCTSQFQFNSNLYWFVGGVPTFYTSNPMKTYSLQQWQSIGEDSGSMVADPMFADALGDNFVLPQNSPAFGIGFAAFDSSLAGLLGGASYNVPFVPQSFPITPSPPSGF